MKIEKWILDGKEVDIQIADEEDFEENVDDLEETKDLSKELEKIGDNDAK